MTGRPIRVASPAPKTEDAIITMGNYCEALLREDSFNALCDEFEQQTVAHILATAPAETARREQVYATVQGKRDFIGLMVEYVQARDKIINPVKDDAEDLYV